MSPFPVNWHYEHHGDLSGVPILFLHGFMARGNIWLPTMTQLSDAFYSVAPDLPGHGQTIANLQQLDFDSLADAIADLVSTHFLRPAALVGYSLGGRIALHTAFKHPDLFSALVLESSMAGIADQGEREKRLTEDIQKAKTLRRTDIRTYLTKWYKQPVFASLSRRPDLIEKIIKKKSHNDVDALAEVVVRLSPGNQPSLWENLRAWDKPALILAGELDDKFCDIARRMGARFPHAEVTIVPDAGHIIHLENNKDFVAALNFFLSSHIL